MKVEDFQFSWKYILAEVAHNLNLLRIYVANQNL